MWSEDVHVFLVPWLSDALSGFGGACLLQFSALPPSADNFRLVGASAVIAALLFTYFKPCRLAPPVWLGLCNSTFSLLMSLSLVLNLLAQLCPPSGKELSLIPAYVLLCIPRIAPSRLALAVLSAITGVAALCFSFSSLPSVRPSGTEPLDTGQSMALFITVLFSSLFSTYETANEMHLLSNTGGMTMLGVLLKGCLLILLGSLEGSSIYYFMFERASSVRYELQVLFGVLLLFACMQTAALWFGQLKALLSRSSSRAVVRIQHIIYALLLAAAWAFPLQLQMLRQLIVACLLALNVVFRL